MKFYTVHLRAGSQPVLVAERFSLLAGILAPFWLAAHRAWIAAALALAAGIAIGVLARGTVAALAWLAYVWLFGLFGRDLQSRALERRGYVLAHVVAARDEEGAHARLLAARPELISGMAP